MMRLLKAILLLFAVPVLLSCKPSPGELAEKLKWQLREERYEQIYDESSDFMHRNVTKAEFIGRLKEIVTKMKEADSELNWRENPDFGKGSGIDGTRYFVRKELGQGSKQIVVLMGWWTHETGAPLFASMSLHFPDQTKNFSVPK